MVIFRSSLGLRVGCSVSLFAYAFGAVLAAAPTLAWSQASSGSVADDDIETLEVRGQALREPILTPMPDQTIVLEGRPLRFETLGDVVSELPGAVVLRQGGVGASQFLSIRGADFDQTLVLIDDVPLTGPDRGPVDFSLLPIDGFAQVDVFRGSAPIRYGGGSIGGVVRLVPKEATDDAVMARGAYASFNTRQVRAEAEGGHGPWSALAAGGGVWADNDFRYVDDNATFADPTDDEVVERENANVAQGNGFLVARWEEGAHRIALLGMVIHQDRGLPGPATVVSRESDQRRTRFLASLGYRLRTAGPRPVSAFATVAFGLDQDRVRDPFGRIGLGREDTNDRFFSVDARAGLFVTLFPWWTLGTTAFYRRDDIRPQDDFATPSDQPSSRDLGLVAAESLMLADLAGAELSLRASVSTQLTWARLTSSRLQDTEVRQVNEVVPNYRLEGRVRLPDSWTISGQFTSGSKLPTTLQLFGNRDTIVANVGLQPERSLSFDAGIAYSPTLGPVSVFAEARAFWLRVEDIIVARRTSRNTIVFENEQEGRTWGVEGWLAFDIGPALESSTSVTWLESRFDNSGFDRDQPLRVPLRVFQRWVSRYPFECVAVFAEIDHRSGFFADAANLVEQPAYTIVNAGVRLTWDDYGLTVAASSRNVFDVLGLDLLAFPRPGRTFEVSLQWKEVF